MSSGPQDTLRLLERLREGDAAAMGDLLPIVYDELHRLAHRVLGEHRPGQTLQTTALVHEAYLKLVGSTDLQFEGRSHFFGVAAKAMRSVVVDHFRARQAAKRKAETPVVALDEGEVASGGGGAGVVNVLALDEALKRLEAFDERKSRVVELRFFAGFTVPQTAEVMGLSRATVEREWRMAKAWLHRELNGGEREGEAAENA